MKMEINSNLKKKLKLFGIIIGVLVTILLVASIGFFVVYPALAFNPPKVSKEKLTQSFTENYEKFSNVIKYVDSIPEHVTIDKDKKNLYRVKVVRNNKLTQLTTNNKKVNEDVTYILNKLKYENIIEGEKEVEFVRTSGLNWSQEIIYSKDGSKPLEYKDSILEPIRDNWYYSYSKSE